MDDIKKRYIIEPGTIEGLRVSGKDTPLCKVEIVNQIDEGAYIRLLVKTYWERRDGISYMRLFPNVLYVINNKHFRVIQSKADLNENEPYNTVLEFIYDQEGGCNKSFYDDKCVVGCGKYTLNDHYEIYTEWKKLIDLVYSDESKRNSNYKLFSEWHSFQNFALWYEENFPKEKSPFGKYMMVWDLGRTKDITLSPTTVLFIEVNIMKFPKLYTYSLETPTVYTMKMNPKYLKAKGYEDYTVLYYSFETERVESLGTFKTLEEARDVYLMHLSNKKTRIINYLKSKGNPVLEPLIMKFETL